MAHALIPQSSARLRARISGALYVLCIGCGFFAEMVVRAKLVVYSDAAMTAHNIAAAPGLYRAGFFLLNTFVALMPKGFGEYLFPRIFVPILVGEGSLAFWLLIMGVNSSKWDAISRTRTI